MVAPIIRRAYGALPAPVQDVVKGIAKTHVERRRSIRVMRGLVRPTVRLEGVVAGISGAVPPPDDLALVRRLLAAYRLAVAEGHATGDSMWTEFFERMHGDIHRVFMSDDIQAAAAILRDPGRSDHFYGFDSLSAQILLLAAAENWRHANAMGVADSLVRLAESVGARRYPYPEAFASGYGQPPAAEPETCLADVEAKLGLSLPTPNPYSDEHGLALKRGVMSYRVPQAVYQAWRARQITRGMKKPAVAEIGGGLGRTAYYARLMGIEDYTIIDLPLSSLAQGYFLGRVLGAENVAFLGEQAAGKAGCVKLVSPKFFLENRKDYDLVVNVDSLTEMSREVAGGYVDRIAAGGGRFLSMNHEFNPFTVRELLEERGVADGAARAPYPMRDGYVEEIVDFGGAC